MDSIYVDIERSYDPEPSINPQLIETKAKKVKVKVCANCGTNKSPAWRRAKMDGTPLFCNACGIFYNEKHKLRKVN